jgi:hypothetical protein
MGSHKDKEESKSSSHKSSKSSHKNSKSKSSKEGSSHKSKKHKKDKNDGHNTKILYPISIDDYFLKMPEFMLWLRASTGRSFETYTSAEAREVFEKKFCKVYSKGKLPSSYYSDNSSTSSSHLNYALKDVGGRTAHQWSFAEKMSESDKDTLLELGDVVNKDTGGSSDVSLRGNVGNDEDKHPHKMQNKASNNIRDNVDDRLARDDANDIRYYEHKQKLKMEKQRAIEYAEELGGVSSKDDHKNKNAKIREDAIATQRLLQQQRDESMGYVLSDSEIFGGTDDVYSQRSTSRDHGYNRSKNNRKEEHYQERQAELRLKEEGRENAWRETLEGARSFSL